MKVVRTVAVHDENGLAHWYYPGDDMPLEHAQLIHNETVFEKGAMDELVELDELPYAQWTVQELAAECATRGLNPKGVKNALIKRLERFDVELQAEMEARQ